MVQLLVTAEAADKKEASAVNQDSANFPKLVIARYGGRLFNTSSDGVKIEKRPTVSQY